MANISVTSISPDSGVGSGIAETVTVLAAAFNGRVSRDPYVLTVERTGVGTPSHTVTLTQAGVLRLSMASQPYTMQSQGTGFTISGTSNARMLRIAVGSGSIVGGTISNVSVVTAAGQTLTVGSGISNANAGYYDLSSDPGADAVYNFSFTFSASENATVNELSSNVNVYAYGSNNTATEPGLSHQLTVNQAGGNSPVDPGGGGGEGGGGEEEEDVNFINVDAGTLYIYQDFSDPNIVDPECTIGIAASGAWNIDMVGTQDVMPAQINGTYAFSWEDGSNDMLYLNQIEDDGSGITGYPDQYQYIGVTSDANETNVARSIDVSFVITSPQQGGGTTGVTVTITQNTVNI